MNDVLSPLARAAAFLTMVVLLDSCGPRAETPMNQPEEVMTAAWGPFARQCTSTRTSHYAMVGREPEDVATTYEACIGFAAMPAAHGAMQITGSTTSNRRSSVPI